MAELKTRVNAASVDAFLKRTTKGERRDDCLFWPLTGFSPRKQNLTLYIMPGFSRFDLLMKKLGRYKTGKSCLYLKRLSDVDLKVLKELVTESVRHMKATHPTR